MHKKIMLACMAIAAFAAFVIAPAASASPVLTDPLGTPVPVHPAGKTCTEDPTGCITATNTGITKFTIEKDKTAVECDHAYFTGIVTANTGTLIKGEVALGNAAFNGTAANTDCTSPLGAVKPTVTSRLCFETVIDKNEKGEVTAHTVKITGCGANVTFSLDVTNVTTCKYAVASVTGTFLTNADATINVSEWEAGLAEPNIFCPSKGWLDMDFDLYTDNPSETTILIS